MLQAKIIRIENGKQVFYDLKTNKIDRLTTWINNDDRAMMFMFILMLLGAGLA